jgi:CBS domain-containing protein
VAHEPQDHPEVVHDQTLLHLPATATVREAAREMRTRHVGAVLVVAGTRLEGIFTERDMVNRVVAEGLDPDGTKLAEVMTRNPDTVGPNDTALVALRRMQDGAYRHLPVVDSGRLVGIIAPGFRRRREGRLDLKRLWERVQLRRPGDKSLASQ